MSSASQSALPDRHYLLSPNAGVDYDFAKVNDNSRLQPWCPNTSYWCLLCREPTKAEWWGWDSVDNHLVVQCASTSQSEYLRLI